MEGVSTSLNPATAAFQNRKSRVMKTMFQRSVVAAAFAAFLALTVSVQAKEKTEDELIAELASANADKVAMAMQQLEKAYPTSTKAHPQIKKLLTDERPKVRRKAARVLGALHAEVSDADIKAICALLKSADPDEAIDGLKALRGLKAPQAVAQITPLLKETGRHANVIRDACRTLAVLGDKSTIPQIEPLLNNPNAAIRKDAQDAIFALKSKS
jgi:HEAT repeat protein